MSPSYEALKAWHSAHALALEVGRFCRTLPRAECFELGSQLRRASRSVPANLVEGHALFSPRGFLRHVRIALGSLAETEYLLRYAVDDGLILPDRWTDLFQRCQQLRGMLINLAKRLESRG